MFKIFEIFISCKIKSDRFLFYRIIHIDRKTLALWRFVYKEITK